MRLGTLGSAIALLAACWIGAAQAADVPTDRPLTVEECVSIALARNPALGVAQAEVQSAEGARLSRWSGVLPHLSAGTSAGRSARTTRAAFASTWERRSKSGARPTISIRTGTISPRT